MINGSPDSKPPVGHRWRVAAPAYPFATGGPSVARQRLADAVHKKFTHNVTSA